MCPWPYSFIHSTLYLCSAIVNCSPSFHRRLSIRSRIHISTSRASSPLVILAARQCLMRVVSQFSAYFLHLGLANPRKNYFTTLSILQGLSWPMQWHIMLLQPQRATRSSHGKALASNDYKMILVISLHLYCGCIGFVRESFRRGAYIYHDLSLSTCYHR